MFPTSWILFCIFVPLSKNTLVDRKDTDKLMNQYAEEEGSVCQSQKMLISSFELQNWKLMNPMLLFYL